VSFALTITLLDIFVYENDYSPVLGQCYKVVPFQPDTAYHLVPLGKVDPVYVEAVKKEIIGFFGFNVKVLPTVPLTDDILTKNKERYDASKILRKFHNKDKKQIILTSVDIAQVKDSADVRGRGIFGMGYSGKHTCVVSTKRITGNNNERIKKVALHEIGHNLGIKEHCINEICIMKEGKNKKKKESAIERIDAVGYFFCRNCMSEIKIPYPYQKKHEMNALSGNGFKRTQPKKDHLLMAHGSKNGH
jgi:predicted Zn-dependent protease